MHTLRDLVKTSVSDFIHNCQTLGETPLSPFNSAPPFRILNSFFLTIPASNPRGGQVTFLKLLNRMTAAF